MNYDYIEIGTSCFETLLQAAPSEGSQGLSIEPLKCYLDKLPAKPGCLKVNVAVGTTDLVSTVKVYYIPESVIRERGLPDWLMGCNCVGAPHPQHGALGILDLVETYEVYSVPIRFIMDMYIVDSVKMLKLDTEGSDAAILLRLHEYIIAKGRYSQWPKTIVFESNELVPAGDVAQVIQRYSAVGYTVAQSGHDTILTR